MKINKYAHFFDRSHLIAFTLSLTFSCNSPTVQYYVSIKTKEGSHERKVNHSELYQNQKNCNGAKDKREYQGG